MPGVRVNLPLSLQPAPPADAPDHVEAAAEAVPGPVPAQDAANAAEDKTHVPSLTKKPKAGK